MQLNTGSCYDCSNIDEFCVACSDTDTCTECTVSNVVFGDDTLPVKLEVSPDAHSCVAATSNCADVFPDDYVIIYGEYHCQHCEPGFMLTDEYKCDPCHKIHGAGCLECDNHVCTVCDDELLITPDGYCVSSCYRHGWYTYDNTCVECCIEHADMGQIMGPDYTNAGVCTPCTLPGCLACHISDDPDLYGHEMCDVCAPSTTWVAPDRVNNAPSCCTMDAWYDINVASGADYSYFQTDLSSDMGCGFGDAYTQYHA